MTEASLCQTCAPNYNMRPRHIPQTQRTSCSLGFVADVNFNLTWITELVFSFFPPSLQLPETCQQNERLDMWLLINHQSNDSEAEIWETEWYPGQQELYLHISVIWTKPNVLVQTMVFPDEQVLFARAADFRPLCFVFDIGLYFTSFTVKHSNCCMCLK